jgi:predicted transposase YdaD
VSVPLEDEQATQEARYLLERNQQEETQPANRAIIERITTITLYKFENKSQREVEEMLGITLKETRVYREIKQEGEKSLILRLLNRRVGELPEDVCQQVEVLSLEELENLGEALLDFSSMADLQVWLNQENI